MNRYGIVFDEQRFYALGGMPTSNIIELLSGEQGVQIDVTQAAQEKELAFLQRLDTLLPLPQVVAVAEHYRGQIPLAVASGGYRDVIDRQLAKIGCLDWFDAIVTAEDTRNHKPAPDVFLEAARQLGVPPQACLVYEDSDLGLQAAAAAGMDAIDVRQ